MKESISIIFAAIVGTFLIVILPLYSILDRQDSMSYNVVLTATTNFVDDVRNKGFIDRNSYNDYIAKLSSTANTYKVNLEVYKNVLIKDVDEHGNIIQDSYKEEKELYNTQDILEVLEDEHIENTNESSIKNNVYLLSENDEIYIRVHNTNITTGSMFYSILSNTTNTEVINISYGGVVNKVNWELYDKINAELAMSPEVLISVPFNEYGNTNIQKVEQSEVENQFIDCSIENTEEIPGGTSIEDICGDILEDDRKYVYLFDLTKRENKTIKVAVELRRFAKIDINGTYVDIAELKQKWNSSIENYIIESYIKQDGFFASTDIELREKNDYYVFDITFTNVTLSQLDYISSIAKIIILPGLGVDEYGMPSLIAESVDIELTDDDAVNTVTISNPINWKKLLKTKSLSESVILNNVVYSNEEIAFLISYTGIKNELEESDEDRDDRILAAIKQYLSINELDSSKSEIQYFKPEDLKIAYDIDIATQSAGHVMVKFKYDYANGSKRNYLSLPNGWIETNLQNTYDEEYEEEIQLYSVGAQSEEYEVLLDDSPPREPTILVEGTKGNNEWYRGNVIVSLLESKIDTIKRNGVVRDGGSGVYRNTLTIDGVTSLEEQEINSKELTQNGKYYAVGKAYDYVGNVSTTEPEEIKIDQEYPTAPTVILNGTLGSNEWYTSDVTINIIPGKDGVSGVEETSYIIKGANAVDKQKELSGRLTIDGKSTIIATTCDRAGNCTDKEIDVYIDQSIPPEAKITVIKGDKNHVDNDWYKTPVTLKVEVNAEQSASGLGASRYKIISDSGATTMAWFEGISEEITISENGTHELTVYTYTKAGNFKEITYTVKIDKNAPNEPTVTINGSPGENNWYISDVNVIVNSNGDIGTSGKEIMTYTLTKKGYQESKTRTQILSGGKIPVYQEGEYILKLYSIDEALNEVEKEPVEIKIDKTAPTAAEFVIDGIKGKEDWYISDVYLSHQGASDRVSGIQSVTLSHESITENTTGTKVILTTKDNAGHSVTKEETIKLDKSVPSAPVINLDKKPTGSGIFGALLYNEYVKVTITPGKDYFIQGIDNLEKTTLEITTNDGSRKILEETETTSFNINQEGIITITARTYDKAGNITTASKVIWIEIPKPETPKLISINGTEIGDTLSKEVVGKSNEVRLEIDNLTEGNSVKIVLINEQADETVKINEIAPANKTLVVKLDKKGKYSIKITQTNMFGKVSDESEGLYWYIYQ